MTVLPRTLIEFRILTFAGHSRDEALSIIDQYRQTTQSFPPEKAFGREYCLDCDQLITEQSCLNCGQPLRDGHREIALVDQLLRTCGWDELRTEKKDDVNG